MKELLRKVKRATDIHARLYLKNDLPVVIYCSGRVGSMAMYHSLEQRGTFTFKVEDMRPEMLANGSQPGTSKWVFDHIVKPGRRAKFILITRNPVALMVSDFFPKLKWLAGSADAYKHMSTQELCELFTTRYFADERHTEKLNWFDSQAKAILGVDVYAHPFSQDDGYTHIQHDPFDILIVQTELNDETKGRVIGEFLELDNLEIIRFNVASNKDYAADYRAFKEQLVIPEAYLEMIYASAYAQHFYGRERMQAMNAQWAAS